MLGKNQKYLISFMPKISVALFFLYLFIFLPNISAMSNTTQESHNNSLINFNYYETLPNYLVFVATLFLGIVAIFQDRIHDYLRKPTLVSEIDHHNSFDVFKVPIEDHQNLIDKTQAFQMDENTLGAKINNVEFYRFKIINTGNSTAEDVEVYITEVYIKEDQGYSRMNVWGNLSYGKSPKLYININPGSYRNCNFGRVIPPIMIGSSPQFLCRLFSEPGMEVDQYFPSGAYRIKVEISCRSTNALLKEYELLLNADGELLISERIIDT